MRNKYSIPTITPEQALAQLARVRLNAIMRAVTGRSIKRVMKRKPQITGAALKTAMKEWYGIDYGYRVRRPANARKVQRGRHGGAQASAVPARSVYPKAEPHLAARVAGTKVQ